MKSYGQCRAVARGLDVAGDGWTQLIVRELLTGPRRNGDLQEGLRGACCGEADLGPASARLGRGQDRKSSGER